MYLQETVCLSGCCEVTSNMTAVKELSAKKDAIERLSGERLVSDLPEIFSGSADVD